MQITRRDILALLSAAFLQPRPASAAPVTDFQIDGGLWYDGEAFRDKTMFAVDGYFARHPSNARPVTAINLRGKYIVPPFGDMHTHRFSGPDSRDSIASFLSDGLFYAQNMNDVPRFSALVAPHVNFAESVDVAFAHGGFTAPGGHPVTLYDQIYGEWEKGKIDLKDLPDAAYWVVDSPETLMEKWPRYLKAHADITKTYIIHSEEFERRKDDPRFLGLRGLDPLLVPHVVRAAGQAGKPVAAHVESAFDFHIAAAANVAQIAHLPGFYVAPDESLEAFRISPEDASMVASRRIPIHTTTLLATRYYHKRPEAYKAVREMQRTNLETLRRYGAHTLSGSDQPNQTAVDEALFLNELGLFRTRDLLQMLTKSGPIIFPHRKIGALDFEFEASFLALAEDPLRDITAIRKVSLAMKQGTLLDVPLRSNNVGVAFDCCRPRGSS